ncbi:DNA-binding IclR family transcriptional regulator [Kibdelosporangium banguiense]|uniref:DNA-binding IclR family transcriptional regulator n=1 Tax=Kibdelosporangium banguiense TaxID=1365924 RepID=A0ABS4TIU1_9PSEU|nr:IclR family transcriptional regulator [Kibdelosporangium banguiense]MBP2324276.1 DNA-binding IclR family transcriptional regulator [Kibdelosporangium banguiense]
MTAQSSESVASRVFRVLDAFSETRPALSLSELSATTGLPLSTTHRLVAELTAWGGLTRGSDGRYRIGLRLLEIGSLSPGTLSLRERAMPFLEDLYSATRQNVQLAVRDELEAVYVERISARGAVNVVTRVGSRMPLHATGVGLILLAHADDGVRDRIFGAPLERFTEMTISGTTRLREVLAAARRDGYVISDRQIEMITQSIAAPIRDATDTVIAALSIVVPVETNAHTLVPAVRAAGHGISRAMGWRPPARK